MKAKRGARCDRKYFWHRPERSIAEFKYIGGASPAIWNGGAYACIMLTAYAVFEHSRIGRLSLTIAGSVGSWLIHSGLLSALVFWIDAKPGAIEQPTEAISLSFQQTEVLDGIEAFDASSSATTVAASAVAASVGVPELVNAQSEPETIEQARPPETIAINEGGNTLLGRHRR